MNIRVADITLKQGGAKRSGVTFIEILIVITIVTTLIFLATPRLKGTLIKNQLQAATRELSATMRLAHSAAVYYGKPVVVYLNVDEGSYWLDLPKLPEQNKEYYPGYDERKREWEQRRYFPRDVAFAEVSTDAPLMERDRRVGRVIFFPNGSATAATIVLTNTRGHKMTIDVPPATGIVRVYKGAPGIETADSASKTGG